MTDFSYINWIAMSDAAIIGILGNYIKHHRLEQNITQSQLAKNAGISRSTLVELEQGKSGNLLTLIRVLRSLNLLQVLDSFQVKQQISPILLAEQEQAKYKRASKRKNTIKKIKTDW